jgi:glycosyltransferase involved in cell wall biosynthesis
MTGPTILHITADFGDPMIPGKTKAVPQLIEGVRGYRHLVYSMNRVSWRRGVTALEFEPDRIAVAYGAPPKGLLLETRLKPVAEFILEDLRRRGAEVDAVHAHKFTIDGLVALPVAKALAKPLVTSVWGDTDLRVMSARRDLKGRWREILDASAAVLPITPWLVDRFEALFPGYDRSKMTVLPAITLTERQSPSLPVGPRLVSVFHLDSHARKGAETMIRAVAGLAGEIPGLALDIYGRGGPGAFLDLAEIIRRAGAGDVVTLKGPVPHEQVHDRLRGYAAFVMPTRRESYGMVFIEALFAGLPLLHTRGWGVDGLFDNDLVGYACDPHSLEDVKHGIRVLLRDEAKLKQGIAEAQRSGRFEHVKRESILSTYEGVLRRVTAGAAAEPAAPRLRLVAP